MMESLRKLTREYDNPMTRRSLWDFVVGALIVLNDLDQRLVRLEEQDGLRQRNPS
jgi:hypothetical protein